MRKFIIAAIIASIPAVTSAQAALTNEDQVKAASATMIGCLNRESEKVAPLTTEPAADMAGLVVTRCSTSDIANQAIMQVLPARSMVLDRIVRWRTGDKSPIVDPMAVPVVK